MSYAAYNQEAILGRLLMDIVHGDLTDDTIRLVDQLDRDDVGAPMGHIVGYVQGMNVAPHMRESINRDLLDELRIITIEQTEALWPMEDEMPTWSPDAPIPEQAVCLLKDMILETLQGKISLQTLEVVDDLDDLKTVPEPYRDILEYAQLAHEDGKQIARDLLQYLRVAIDQPIKMRS